MCDPLTIGLMVGGSVLQGVAQGQIAGAQKKSIAANGASYDKERDRQSGFQAENMGTFGDTLSNYSMPSQQKAMDANVAKRTADYASPFENRNFAVERPADFSANSAVDRRNAQTGAGAKKFAVGEAMAKAVLDAYGDTQTGANIYSANNSNKIGTVNRIAAGSANAEQAQQNTLQSKLEADKQAGAVAGGLGDLLSAASMMSGMAGGVGSFGSKLAPTNFAYSPGSLGARLSLPTTISGANVAGSGLLGMF